MYAMFGVELRPSGVEIGPILRTDFCGQGCIYSSIGYNTIQELL